MANPKGIEKIFVAALVGIELNSDDLGVVGGACADVVVSGIMEEPLAVSDFRLRDAWNSLEGELHAPEASGAELRELLARRRDVVVGALSDGRRRRRINASVSET